MGRRCQRLERELLQGEIFDVNVALNRVFSVNVKSSLLIASVISQQTKESDFIMIRSIKTLKLGWWIANVT